MTLTAQHIVKQLHRRLPSPLRKVGARLDYALASRPRVHKDSLLRGTASHAKGTVTLSLDFELAWAWIYARDKSVDPLDMARQERAQVPILLEEFDALQFPATWATVGHLFLTSCSRDAGGRAHPHLRRIPYFETAQWRFSQGDWYQYDPCTSLERDPCWYCPDLIGKVLNARVRHEVACHSFSHAGFGPYCPPGVAADEIGACKEAMAPFGLRPTTFVFPGNDVGNFDALARQGVKIVRAFPDTAANLALPVLGEDGMWRLHVSSATSRGRTWSMAERLVRLKKFVEYAARYHVGAHVWLHPSLPAHDMQELLFPFLRYCVEQREKGVIDILTMTDLVARASAVHDGGG